jgi:PEP-CTERM motif
LKKLLLVGLLGFGFHFGASAMPLCSSIANNLAAFQAAGSCQALDTIFSGFNYDAGATGVTAANVTANLTTFLDPTFIETGFLFSPIGAARWNSSITIGYTVKLCDATCTNDAPDGFTPTGAAPGNAIISQAQTQEFTPRRDPTGNPIVTNSFVGNSSTLTLTTSNISNATLTNSGFFGTGNNMVVVSTTSGTGNMTSIEDDVMQTFTPEPGTLFLVGGGLMLAGLKIKKWNRK